MMGSGAQGADFTTETQRDTKLREGGENRLLMWETRLIVFQLYTTIPIAWRALEDFIAVLH
jgi:hypothetical protein